MMQFKNSHRNFFLECLTCGVSSLTLSYLSLKVIAPLDKIVFYVSLYIHSRLTSFSDIEAFSPSLVSSTCFFLVRDFCTLSLLFVTWEFIFFAWSFHFDPNLASFLEKFSNVLLQYRSFILVSFKFFSSVWSFAKRAVNIIRWRRKHCDFPVLTKGRCPYSSCHIYWPTVDSTFDLVLTLLIGIRCLIIEFCFKVLYSCNSL